MAREAIGLGKVRADLETVVMDLVEMQILVETVQLMH